MKRKYVGIYRKTCVYKAERVSICYVRVFWWKSRTLRPSSRVDPWRIYPFYGFFFLGGGGYKKLSVHYTRTTERLRWHKKKWDLRFPQRNSWIFVWDTFFLSKCIVHSYWVWRDVTLLWNVCDYLTSTNSNILQTWIFKTIIFQFWIWNIRYENITLAFKLNNALLFGERILFPGYGTIEILT